jgi:glycosyltransferase involved in cell wall biosynthesis
MISAIVIAKNEEKMIAECLHSLEFAKELILVDSGSTDKTVAIAKQFKARIVTTTGSDYSQFRNQGAKSAHGDWLLYVDADERVTPALAAEILDIVSGPPAVYQLQRANYYLGQKMNFGGWGDDKVIRLFHRSQFIEFVGQLHEQPRYHGSLLTTTATLNHFSHRGLTSMLYKTLDFTDHEAKLRLASNHPPVVWWRFFRVMLTEFWFRFVIKSAWRDGPVGIIDGFFQVFNSFVIYARLWELQNESHRS